ncbi:hypothetical protein ACFL0Q_09785 [Thermodesulfobacteriota bacterium]
MKISDNGFLEDAPEHWLKAVDYSERIEHPTYQDYLWIGNCYSDMEEYQKSIDSYRNVIFDVRSIQSMANAAKVGVIRAKLMNNEKDVDPISLDEYVKKNRMKLFEGMIQRHIGEILLRIDDHHMQEAEAWINKAIEASRRNGMMWEL